MRRGSLVPENVVLPPRSADFLFFSFAKRLNSVSFYVMCLWQDRAKVMYRQRETFRIQLVPVVQSRVKNRELINPIYH